ncbi:DEAD/DEAH box helicase [Ktedonosporobacter rubrisoli]|uniref:DEAD/DEAH box helicase n=1 Tax=Ktedonosporobacter rubrisoli TaxID=2509675 RepID=A0A4V0YZD0_KTERU|nr:DEAD/DEAH box helicase [Ktedonosporobacter rubrisoli]QBD79291.1 DEAD/DEAH box helicase [Ktedonosporobacter rubrisoli]
MDEYVEAGYNHPEISAGIQEFIARYPFSIDQFQLEAIGQLAHGQSVLVAAPTGTGKTLVAEYAIWLAQQRNQRVIYTTPLKALSNQKYRDLRELYGHDTVGLVTGDIVEHSRASIVIMTTEVYRNMLLEEGGENWQANGRLGLSSLNDVGFVVFDELHYLSDVGRGPVWEEAIICSPPHVQLVGLSATVSNAEDLASWISRVHRPVSLVTHEQRAVPLEHFYFLDGKLHLVQDADGKRVERFPHIGGEAKLARMLGRGRTFVFDEEEEDEDELDADLWERRRKGRGERARSEHVAHETHTATEEVGQQEQQRPRRQRQRKTPEAGELLTALRDADLLPCLYFLPGRRVVEEAAMSSALHHFTTPEEEALIREEVGVWLENLPKEDRNLQQVHALLGLLPRGLAFHHAGLLPGLKVLVETLFARGYLRAVFATDTLALGINMPARSVIVGSLSKFDGQEMRLLTPNEYRQLTGRAGRRGMDVRGAAIIPYSPWEPFEASFQRITADLLPVTSSFVIRYNSVLNLWRPGDVQHLRRICASSLREYQRYLLWELSELHRLEKRYRKASKSGKKKKGAASESALQALEKRRQRIGAFPLSRAGAAELDGTIFALRALGYIGQDDRLTLKGQLLRSIFHPAGIMIIELMLSGALDELSAAELAEVCSWFTFDNDRRLNNRDVIHARLSRIRRELWQIAQHVHGIEERAGLSYTPDIVAEFHGIALAWSRGMTLVGLLKRIDLAEGDILMILNQSIDLLQQVQSAVGQVLDAPQIWEEAPPVMIEGAQNSRTSSVYARRRDEQLRLQRERLERLRPLLGQASASLLHGIIVQSRTVPSMVAHVGEEAVPLDAEEDRDAHGIDDAQAYVGDV